MRALDIITAKRDGAILSNEQIRWFISTYAKGGAIADEQAAALTMAIFFQGMSPGELATWTTAMIDTGERLDLADVGRPTVDKHSTGGVGDKISLILVPLVAACGAAVPQLSGRGLGHTGGTLDKMESIPGWRPDLSPAQIRSQLRSIGAVIAGATASIAPADRKLYALRDVTGTVESIPLIASSIMSKKIAEGTSALVLDVKFGSGAFMADRDRATTLARTMVEIGRANGVATTALVTRMDTPLGRAAGNAVEVQESLDVLAGGGPADVIDLTVALAQEMLRLVGIDADPGAVLASGEALDVFDRMVRAQGGDLSAGLPVAAHREFVVANSDGWVDRLDARAVGLATWRLGAGRARKEDDVSATAGIICHAKPGDAVKAGDVILELRTDDTDRLPAALDALRAAIDIASLAPTVEPVVAARIDGNGASS